METIFLLLRKTSTIMSGINLGALILPQITHGSDYDSANCGTATSSTVKCGTDSFDTGKKVCTFGPDQRYCTHVDSSICDRVPEWAKFSEAKYSSGTSLTDAKVSCTWTNIDDALLTPANIRLYETMYGGEDPLLYNADKGYNKLYASYCLDSLYGSDCMIDVQTGRNMSECSRVHAKDASTRTFCSSWWSGMSASERDSFLAQACAGKPNKGDCGCVNTPTEPSSRWHDEYEKVQGQFAGSPANCWFKPCLDINKQSQFRESVFDTKECNQALCVNINEITVEEGAMAQFIDSQIKQNNYCEVNVENNLSGDVGAGVVGGTGQGAFANLDALCAVDPNRIGCPVQTSSASVEDKGDDTGKIILTVVGAFLLVLLAGAALFGGKKKVQAIIKRRNEVPFYMPPPQQQV